MSTAMMGIDQITLADRTPRAGRWANVLADYANGRPSPEQTCRQC